MLAHSKSELHELEKMKNENQRANNKVGISCGLLGAGCVKTLLVVRTRLDERIAFIEKKINRIVISSFDSLMNAEAVVDKILERLVRKQKLLMLRNKIDDLIESLPEKCAQVIRLCFLNKLSAPQIAERCGFSLRTVFRYLNEGIERSIRKLERVGISDVLIEEILKDFKWIAQIYYAQIGNLNYIGSNVNNLYACE